MILAVGGCVHAGTSDMVFGREEWSRQIERTDLDPAVADVRGFTRYDIDPDATNPFIV